MFSATATALSRSPARAHAGTRATSAWSRSWRTGIDSANSWAPHRSSASAAAFTRARNSSLRLILSPVVYAGSAARARWPVRASDSRNHPVEARVSGSVPSDSRRTASRQGSNPLARGRFRHGSQASGRDAVPVPIPDSGKALPPTGPTSSTCPHPSRERRLKSPRAGAERQEQPSSLITRPRGHRGNL